MEFVNFVEVVLDDDEDEGTEASELFFFRYWYDICTSSLLLYSLTLSLFLSYSLTLSLSLSLSLCFPREIQEFLSEKQL